MCYANLIEENLLTTEFVVRLLAHSLVATPPMKYVLLLTPLMLIGCGPGEGGIYENLLTRERVEIAGSGDCQELKASLLEAWKAEDKVSSGSYISVLPFPFYVSSDTTGSCVYYNERSRRPGGFGTTGKIMNVSDMDTWEKVK